MWREKQGPQSRMEGLGLVEKPLLLPDPLAAGPPRGQETEAGVPGRGQSLEVKLRWGGGDVGRETRVPRTAGRNSAGRGQDGRGVIPDVTGSAGSIWR